MKEKIKKLLKNKKAVYSIIGTLCFLIVGLIAFFLGTYFSGWNIWSWFSSDNAIFWYVMVFAVALPIIIYLFILWRNMKDERRK